MAEKMQTPDYILDIRKGKYSKEGAVSAILRECNITKFPINVWNIARKLNFRVLEATFRDKNTSGMMIDADEVPEILKDFGCKRAIILNRNEEKNIQSFTIAHELAHFAYDCNESINCFDAYHISRERDGEELTAEERADKEKEDERDRFAAMLLMPEEMFRTYVNSSKNRNNRSQLAKELSEVCLVAEEAVERRFDELGIIF